MYYIIVNPASKSGKGIRIWSTLETVLKKRGIPFQVYFSETTGHVTELVRKICDRAFEDTGCDQKAGDKVCRESKQEPLRLIALGGDGTLNEVLQGISDFDRVQVGYIPTGSSNDMARDLRLPKDPYEVLNRILECKKPTRMDLGCLTYETAAEEYARNYTGGKPSKRYFAVSSGIGFDAAICEEALKSGVKNILNKIGLGKLTYVGIALKQLLAAKKTACDIYLDDRELVHLDRFFFITGMIHRYEGGGFKFCPDANAGDGMLDVCVVGNISKPLVLKALPTAFQGEHYRYDGIDSYRVKQLRIVTAEPFWVHTDGEVSVKATAIRMSCEKERLQLLL